MDALAEQMEAYADKRSAEWEESESGEIYLDAISTLMCQAEEMRDADEACKSVRR